MICQSSLLLLLLMYEVSLGGNLYNGLTLITTIQLVYCKVTRNVGGKYDNIDMISYTNVTESKIYKSIHFLFLYIENWIIKCHCTLMLLYEVILGDDLFNELNSHCWSNEN